MSLSSGRMHPKKFAMWVGIVSMIMSFAALTSAYIVRRAASNWMDFELPQEFFTSTAVIIISSLTLHGANKAFEQGKESMFKILLILSLVAGLGFVVMQYAGWNALSEKEIFVNTNPSSSFLYLLTALHVFHVLGGIIALLIAVFSAFLRKFEISPRRKLNLELVTIYWHFVDVLWIYLLVFFIVQQ